jgi:Raf kinase inhibitor-like YbhB/YbcL family protein
MRRRRMLAPALALALVAGLAGCGESASSSSSNSPGASGSTSSTSAAATGAAVSSVHSVSSGAAVASVAGKPITKSSYEHWLTVERALGASSNASHRALGFLLTTRWLLDEAAGRRVAVSTAEVARRLGQLKQQSFPQAGSLQRFLARTHETEGDLSERVKAELLESQIAAQVSAGQSGAQRKTTLARFQQAFQGRWKARTTCAAAYLMEDCAEYRGKPEDLAAASSAPASSARPPARSGATGDSGSAGASGSTSGSSSTSGSGSTSTVRSSGSSGEVYSSPGAMAISSPAFERNGAIPAQYTCDGANISPPLEWQNVPAKAAALVLFIIDDSPSGSASGIRWVVGDISPSARGVAAGKTPEGAIVGSDTQGHSGYGGICPDHGKTSTVEFVLYALSKRIALSPGFSPTTAESEYGSGKDLLGSAAITYAVYHRS